MNGTFYLDKATGRLSLAKSLDREKCSEYQLTVSAVDEGNLKSQKRVDIIVSDVNDSPPSFEKDYYSVDFDFEDLSPGQQLIRFVVNVCLLAGSGGVTYCKR